MLKQKRLDDQNFIEIANRSRRLIQKYAPDWTNENASDPGIAILEMLAWLKDSMQYYMDQSHLISTSAYMELLGIHPRSAVPAEMIVRAIADKRAFENRLTLKLPVRYPLTADETPFELADAYEIQNTSLRAIYSSNTDFSRKAVDLSSAFDNKAKAYPFSQTPYMGACLYLGFDNLDIGRLSMYFNMEDDPEGFRNPCDLSNIPFAKGVWEIADPSGEEVVWRALKLHSDETHNFMEDGIVTLYIDGPIHTFGLLKGELALVWLRFRVTHTSYDRSPVCKNIVPNGMRLKQLKTHAYTLPVSFSDLTDENEIVLEHFIEDGAQILLQSLEGEIYHTLKDSDYSMIQNDDGSVRIRLLETNDFTDRRMRLVIGQSSAGGINIHPVRGLPFDTIESAFDHLVFSSVEVEVNEDHQTDIWHSWKPVRHLWASTASSRHICINPEAGTFEFGNNEIGALPDPKEQGFRIISASSSRNEFGNGHYTKILPSVTQEQVRFEPLTRARFGKREETPAEAIDRFKASLMVPEILNSREHIERVIKATPGLAIRDVSVLAGEHAGKKGRIVVLSKTFEKQPQLPAVYQKLIETRMEETRLMTESWTVSGPEYIEITVKAEIIKDPAVDLSRKVIENAVREFIEPAYGKRFGRHYASSRLMRKIEKISGVIRVSRLNIQTKSGICKKSDGDIQLPETAIGKLTAFDLQILNNQGW